MVADLLLYPHRNLCMEVPFAIDQVGMRSPILTIGNAVVILDKTMWVNVDILKASLLSKNYLNCGETEAEKLNGLPTAIEGESLGIPSSQSNT